MNDNIKEKTLWMLQYRFISPAGKPETLTRLKFFYVQDKQEAEQICTSLLIGKERIPEYSNLQPCEHGVIVAQKFLPGKLADERSEVLERV